MNDIHTDDVSAPGLVERLKALFLKPAQTWPVIAAEPATPGDLFRRYAVPLAAIGPLGTFLHGQLFGYVAFGFSYTPGLVAGLTGMIVTYVTALVGVGILAVVADWLAPKFAGTANRANAFKLVIFGSTAAWLAGIFQLVPGLGVLGLAGLYSLYLYYTGAAPLMKVPQDKTLAFTAVTILCAIGLYMVVGALGTRFTAMAGGSNNSGTIAAAADDGQAEISIPGIGNSTQQRSGLQLKGEAKPVSGAQLKTLMPTAIGNY